MHSVTQINDWLLNGLFWILAAAIISGISYFIKKGDLKEAITTLIIGSIIIALAKNPDSVISLSKNIADAIGIITR